VIQNEPKTEPNYQTFRQYWARATNADRDIRRPRNPRKLDYRLI